MADLFDRAGVAWRLDRDALDNEGVDLDDQKSAVSLELDAVPIEAVVDVGQMLAVLELGTAGRLSGGSLSVRRPGYRFEADEAVRSALLKTVGAVQFENQPLNEVLKQLGARLRVNIWLDEADLQDEGHRVTKEVSLVSDGDLQARVLLNQLLNPIDLTCVVDEGLLKVTTLVAAEEWLVDACLRRR